jgi:ATP-dependent Clp protease adapter protein ClpS
MPERTKSGATSGCRKKAEAASLTSADFHDVLILFFRAMVVSEGAFMDDVYAGDAPVRLVFHNANKTPVDFVRELLRTVFGKPEKDAIAFTAAINQQGEADCGPYPASVAKALINEAQERIRAAGHNLLLTGEAASANEDDASEDSDDVTFIWACDALQWHFADFSPNQLVTTVRQFPGHMRADVQVAIAKLFAAPVRFFGIDEDHRYESASIARLMRGGRAAVPFAPAQYHELDIGETTPVKCLQNGLWLCEVEEFPYAVVLSMDRDDDRAPIIRIEIAMPAGAAGEAFVQRSFVELEKAVHAARSYRGKILSFDRGADYRGRTRGIMVHRLPPVAREEVILSERTLRLLDRNIMTFVGSRDALRRLGQSTRKGILLYGPPGTGKTHTIRYLATNLPGHTTLIITAEQIALLDAYMTLARLLQPSLVVIEDVDLIASDREEMGPCEESLLNRLLNEMDGLKEDADILFVLTTNRPEELESALAGRPGRIDQAIEVPLPDEDGRARLVRLYGRGLPLDRAIIEEAARRTEGVSAAFIKELKRRIAQSAIARDRGNSVISADIDEALDVMLFSGGRLNVKLLGGAQEMARAS